MQTVGSFTEKAREAREPSGGSSEQPWQAAACRHSRLGARLLVASHWGNTRARRVLNPACEAATMGQWGGLATCPLTENL